MPSISLESRSRKIEMIESLNCDVFVDDLPEVFEDQMFPEGTKKILFDPSLNMNNTIMKFESAITAWTELPNLLSKL